MGEDFPCDVYNLGGVRELDAASHSATIGDRTTCWDSRDQILQALDVGDQ